MLNLMANKVRYLSKARNEKLTHPRRIQRLLSSQPPLLRYLLLRQPLLRQLLLRQPLLCQLVRASSELLPACCCYYTGSCIPVGLLGIMKIYFQEVKAHFPPTPNYISISISISISPNQEQLQ